MTYRSTLWAPLAIILLASPASPAQQQPATPARQPAPTQIDPSRLDTSQLDTSQLTRLTTQPPTREPRPDAPVAMPISWGQAAEDIQLQARQFQRTDTVAAVAQGNLPFARPTNPEAAGVANTGLPVLIPGTAALGLDGNARVLLFPRENFYNLSITAPGLVIEVFGTRLAHARAPDPLSTRRLNAGDSDGYRISQTEYGRELSFNRYGAAYSITVECDSPDSDPRCRTDAYVRNLANSLIIAAGNPASGGQ
ncbi:hypothetical protein AWH62_06910 [Maricaulis sp. W15]|uniref:Uncharacterized protein n=1 Tax=Maricaulis maris TaxID=74318 RepID=A0A495DDG3_9PROT|nr:MULTISPECIES: hypothetical protein [Maricaulis]OLF73882.1 hypothetical protein AWH62_06910 [Maricaulis sp. W15]RKR00342.1 hypothetical protein C7435_1548 [Maricaulis maris]